MPTILAVTVGGSCAPVFAAVRDYAPDYVQFVATAGPRGSSRTVDGPGKPCGRDPDRAPSIVSQLELSRDHYDITELEDPDALADIYATCRRVLRELSAEFPGGRLLADFTGGTKSMSVGLALAALEAGWQLSLVKGMRPDLVQVADGTEMAGLVNAWEVRARQQMAEGRRLFNAYAYGPAGELLESLARQAPLSPQLDRTVRTWVAYCRGFDAWDRFDHSRAVALLSTVPGDNVPWRFLKAITGEARATGYEPVLDLVRNAERRATRGRFDDAVARLYRALEMLAQTRLGQRKPRLDSADLDLEALPEAVRPPYERRRELNEIRGSGSAVRLGLMDDYELLFHLDDPLGQVFAAWRNRLQGAIEKRNHSILAHGCVPLGPAAYRQVHTIASGVVADGLRELGIEVVAPQFPLLGPDGLQARAGE